jgi:hypothetical protein
MKQVANLKERTYDASCMSDYLHCPKLFYWRWVRGLVPKEEPAPLLFGKVFHDALFAWYKTGDKGLALKQFEQIPAIGIGDDRRTREHGIVILEEYLGRWGTENWKVLTLEKEFKIEMSNQCKTCHGTGIITQNIKPLPLMTIKCPKCIDGMALSGKSYAGRLDEVVEWNGQIYVVDHKTTSQLGSYFFKGFRPNVQMDGYAFACRKLWGQCSGVVINGVSIAAKPKERFGRDVSTRTPEEIDRFAEQFELWTNEIENSINSKVWPLHYTACHNYGDCRYLELCLYGESGMEDKFKREE